MAPGSEPAGARCFVAVIPPDPLVRLLRSMERPQRDGLRWTREAQWHVTVAFFASVEPGDLVASLDRLGTALPEPPSARAESGPHPLPLGGRVWALPVGGLGDLAAAVGVATSDLEQPRGERPSRPFRGHLTLARARHPALLRDLPLPDLRVSWQPTEVTAFVSRIGRGAAAHEIIGRWPLPRE